MMIISWTQKVLAHGCATHIFLFPLRTLNFMPNYDDDQMSFLPALAIRTTVQNTQNS